MAKLTDPRTAKTILVIHLGALGDFVLSFGPFAPFAPTTRTPASPC